MTLRVLVVDDQALVRTGFRMILESEPGISVVGEAEDGLRAVERALELRPDVVLMDIRMPQMDGIEATRRLIAADPAAKVLVLTTFDLDEYVYEALRAGASGFMLKDAPPEQLIVAVRTIAAGEALLAPSITRRLIEQYVRRPGPSPARPMPSERLTSREVEVLALIGRGSTNGEIAAELVLSEATVKTHVAHIFGKLDLRDRAQAVVYAYEAGIVQPGQRQRPVGDTATDRFPPHAPPRPSVSYPPPPTMPP